jgi:hypothetical protein
MSPLRFVAAALAVTLLLLCADVGTAEEADFAAWQRYYLAAAPQKYEPLPLFAQKYAAPQKSYVVPQAYAVPQKSSAQKYAVPQKYVVPQKSYAVPLPAGHCEPKIIYRHHACCRKRGCCSCQSPYQVLLPVSDPRCPTRVIQIPVPVPSCCNNLPWEKDRCGVFVRGVTTFCWPCGYQVRVVWLHRGDVVVHTYGVPVSASVKAYGPSQSYYAPAPAPRQPTPAVPPSRDSGDGPELLPPGGREF